MRIKKTLAVAAVATIALATLAACGSDGSDGDASSRRRPETADIRVWLNGTDTPAGGARLAEEDLRGARTPAPR